jgi:hypothetical protein
MKYMFVKKMGNETFATHYKKGFRWELEATGNNNSNNSILKLLIIIQC